MKIIIYYFLITSYLFLHGRSMGLVQLPRDKLYYLIRSYRIYSEFNIKNKFSKSPLFLTSYNSAKNKDSTILHYTKKLPPFPRELLNDVPDLFQYKAENTNSWNQLARKNDLYEYHHTTVIEYILPTGKTFWMRVNILQDHLSKMSVLYAVTQNKIIHKYINQNIGGYCMRKNIFFDKKIYIPRGKFSLLADVHRLKVTSDTLLLNEKKHHFKKLKNCLINSFKKLFKKKIMIEKTEILVKIYPGATVN